MQQANDRPSAAFMSHQLSIVKNPPPSSVWECMGIVCCSSWTESQKTSTLTALLTLEQDTNVIDCFSGPGQWRANEACFNGIPDWKYVHAKLEQLCAHTGLSVCLSVLSSLSLSNTSVRQREAWAAAASLRLLLPKPKACCFRLRLLL